MLDFGFHRNFWISLNLEKGKARSEAELHRMKLFLGIDAGGTKTAAVIADAAGTERGRGAGGPCSLATGDYPQWTRAVREAARSACQAAGLPEDTRFAAVCAGVAGYSLKAKRAEFTEILAEEISADHYDLTPDYEIAYWGASGGEPGVVVIAGTGSVAFGRNAQGETCKVGGLGYVLGDVGSGFALGISALQEAIGLLKGGRPYPLANAVIEETGARSLEDLLSWIYTDFSPAKIAALAPIAGRLADAGDTIAQAKMRSLVAGHIRQTSEVIHQLALPPDAPVYRLGGLWKSSAFLRSLPFTPTRSTENADSTTNVKPPQRNLREPIHDAAIGAALFAQHKAK